MSQGIGVSDHMAIAVRSLATAREFYERVLGSHFIHELERPTKVTDSAKSNSITWRSSSRTN
jgi:catechol 2,3-dioxygenase-like lactoylglutathione lyase family enzyme